MKILKVDRRNSYFEVVPENLDDLWHLERVLGNGDVVSGKTERKIKPREEGEKPFRQDIYIELNVEGVELHRYSGKLRIAGTIVGGKPEQFIELKAHHTLDVGERDNVKVRKEKLKGWQIKRLEKAKKASVREKLLLVVLDDEEASFALLKDFGFEERGKVFSGKAGKQYESEGGKGRYFSEIIKKVEDLSCDKVVFAGPGFTKEDLQKYISDKGIEVRAYFESLNSVGITGLNELVKGKALEKVAKELQVANEMKLVEKIFEELGKNSGLVNYGEAVGKAAEAGAVEKLAVLDRKLLDEKEGVEEAMEKAEQLGGEVHIINEENEAGKKLKSLGGIAALLRYKFAG